MSAPAPVEPAELPAATAEVLAGLAAIQAELAEVCRLVEHIEGLRQ